MLTILVISCRQPFSLAFFLIIALIVYFGSHYSFFLQTCRSRLYFPAAFSPHSSQNLPQNLLAPEVVVGVCIAVKGL